MLGWGRGLAMGAAMLSLGSLGPGCGSSSFVCEDDSQCGSNGVCQAPGYCSFPDIACESGLRFGDAAGDFGGECVPVDGGSVSVGSQTSADSEAETTLPTTLSTTSSGTTTVSDAGSTTEKGVTSNVTTLSSSTTAEVTTQGLTSGSSGGDSSSTGEPVERVSDGIVVLYDFRGMPTTTVQDVSGVSPAYDMDVVGPGFDWTETGLVKTTTDSFLQGQGPPTKIHSACQATNEMTVEVWASSETASANPSRLISYSVDTSSRNFTLGLQDGVGVVWRFRSDLDVVDNENGLPGFVADVPFAPGPTHILATREAGGTERIYVDGEAVFVMDRPGDFSDWDAGASYVFVMGDEVSLDRPWLGEFHLAAIYERALSGAEVAQNFAAGF